MLKRAQFWIPGIIFLASLCLHLSLISKGPVTVDCLNLVIQSQATIDTLRLHYLYGSGYPVMVLLGSIFIIIGKYLGITDPVLAVNYVSVLFGSLATLAYYLLIRRFSDTLTAILSAIILLFNPIFMDVSTYGINHTPALCFLFLGLCSLLNFQEKGKTRDLWLSALYFGLMGATRLQDLILLFPAISFMFFAGLNKNPWQNKKNKIRLFQLLMAATFFIILVFHLPYIISDQRTYAAQATIFWKVGFIDNFKVIFSRPLEHSLFYLIRTFSAVGDFCFIAGLFYAAKINKRILAFTLLWIAIPLMFYGNALTNAPRFFNIIIPAVIIPIGIFLAQMLRYNKIAWTMIVMVSFLIMIFQPLMYSRQTFLRRHQQALISDYYIWVGKNTEPDATIISADDNIFIDYYAKRGTLDKPVRIGHLSGPDLAGFKIRVDKILNEHKPVYVTDFGINAYDYYEEFRNFLNRNYRLTQVGKMPLEVWYATPYQTLLNMYALIKISKKN